MEDIAKVLTNYGFPVTVAFFLLWKLQPLIDQLNKTISEFSGKIDRVIDAVARIEESIQRKRK